MRKIITKQAQNANSSRLQSFFNPVEIQQLRDLVNGKIELWDNNYHGLVMKLYEYYATEMPYGVAKARDGDPYEWLEQAVYNELQEDGLL